MRIGITRQDSFSDFAHTQQLPWSQFFKGLVDEGHEIVSLYNKPDLVIFMNHHRQSWSKNFSGNTNGLKVLILWESSVTKPQNYQSDNIQDYDLIFTPSSQWIAGENVFSFIWPQGKQRSLDVNQAEFLSRDSRPVVFQNKKVSLIEGEMYSLRRALLKEFDEELVVYGKGWNSKIQTLMGVFAAFKNSFGVDGSLKAFRLENLWIQPKDYRGHVSDKTRELKKFQFNIVVENSLDYISEKLFESLWAGCCVLYVGPPLQDFGIPKVALECQPNVKSLKDMYHYALQNPKLVEETRICAERFLLSDQFKNMNNEIVLEKLAKDILKQIAYRQK